MNNCLNIICTNEVNLSLYEKLDLLKIMNPYNQLTVANLDILKKLLKNQYFKVPSKIYLLDWGTEKVFVPFTNKLFKVLETTKGDTSVQLHPLKTEKYFSLSDDTVITNGQESVNLNLGTHIYIPRNTIHCMRNGSKVFEEQDNLIFDNKETVRLYDKLGRKVDTKQDYMKYLLPQFLDKWNTDNIENYTGNNNKFVFIEDGIVTIKFGGKIVNLTEREELYYLGNDVEIVKYSGLIRIIECNYYGLWK